MGAYTCQYGTVHKVCRCPTPHSITCPTPGACAPAPGRHKADTRPLEEDVSGATMGPPFDHSDGRCCTYHNRLRLWVTIPPDATTHTYVECLRDDHPRRGPVTRDMPMGGRP